jgi:competence protein ComEC
MMTGFGVSTIRAVCMFLVMIFGDIVGRTYDMASGAALAAIMILLRNPLQARSAGFLLSFGAVFGICCVYKILHSVIPCEKKWLQSLEISFSILLVTYPVSVHFFYEYPLYSMLLNLIVIPAMPLVMGFGAAAMTIGSFAPVIGKILGIPAHLILSLYELLGECTLNLPLSVARIGCEKPWQLTVYYGLLLVALLGMWYGRRTIYTAVLPLALLVVTLRFSPDLQFTMLDVGQGDGMFFRIPDGTVCCIDGGSANVKNVGKYRLLPYLKYEGVSTVNIWVLSHLDEDHMSGVREILEMYGSLDGIKIERMLFPELANPDEVYKELWMRAKECGIVADIMGEGDLLQGENWTFTCLSPEKEKLTNDKNEDSVVLQLEFEEFSMLLTGDCGFETEEKLVREKVLTPVDVWKVSHHGSKYSRSESFLKEIDPQMSLISVEENNYGHPSPDILRRLESAGSFTKTTLENGALMLESDGEHYTLSLQRDGD